MLMAAVYYSAVEGSAQVDLQGSSDSVWKVAACSVLVLVMEFGLVVVLVVQGEDTDGCLAVLAVEHDV